MAAGPLSQQLRARIDRDGPMPVSAFVAAALYDPEHGFYAGEAAGQAGRRGDFLTAPEVGPLFGAVIARAIDAWWDEAGRPARFRVAEHGAGPGTLARSVVAAAPAVLAAGALRWDLIEISAAQRAGHPEHPALRSVAEPDDEAVDVVLANELLDNLPFDVVRRGPDGWHHVAVGHEGGGFGLLGGTPAAPPPGAVDVPVGTTLPVHGAAVAWVEARLAAGCRRLVTLDYAAPTVALAARGDGWLRTYRGHETGGSWLADPGSCDITTDLALEQFESLGDGAAVSTQAVFLRRFGIDELVDAGRRAWEEGAARGDLAALRGRSWIREAEALTDPEGMGGFTVLEWGATTP